MSEMFIKMYGLGKQAYLNSSFNTFDCIVSHTPDCTQYAVASSLELFPNHDIAPLCLPQKWINLLMCPTIHKVIRKVEHSNLIPRVLQPLVPGDKVAHQIWGRTAPSIAC